MPASAFWDVTHSGPVIEEVKVAPLAPYGGDLLLLIDRRRKRTRRIFMLLHSRNGGRIGYKTRALGVNFVGCLKCVVHSVPMTDRYTYTTNPRIAD
jgi:hypothetical protein